MSKTTTTTKPRRIALILDSKDEKMFADALRALQRTTRAGKPVTASDVLREGMRLLAGVDK